MGRTTEFFNVTSDAIVAIVSIIGINGKGIKSVRHSVQQLCDAYIKRDIDEIMIAVECVNNTIMLNSQAYTEEVSDSILENTDAIAWSKAIINKKPFVNRNGRVYNPKSSLTFDTEGSPKMIVWDSCANVK